MRNHLRNGPVRIVEVGPHQTLARLAGFTKALRNGASASVVTIHGDNVLAKFFDRNGPRGWYSHGWMSRAVQSLNSAIPKTRDSASSIGTASPRSFGVPMTTPNERGE